MTTIALKTSVPSFPIQEPEVGQKEKVLSSLFKDTREIVLLILAYRGDDVEDVSALVEVLQKKTLTTAAEIIDELFNKYAPIEADFIPISRALLEMRPAVIYQTLDQEVSFYSQAILQGHFLKAEVFLQAMNRYHIGLTDADLWIQRAMRNDCNFTQEDFLTQPIGLCQQMYQVANMHVQMQCVQKLRDYGMRDSVLPAEGLALFSCNMDVVDIAEVLTAFLRDLRRKGLLFTKEEFRRKDRAQYYDKGRGRSNDGLGRILGRDLIERTAERLHLSHIKVPQKTAVIPEGRELAFGIQEEWGPESGFNIYAEKIVKVRRKATRAEMLETLTLIEEVGFCASLSNVWVGRNADGEEGVFFIDTEYRAFSHLPSYSDMKNLENLMDPQDHEWFLGEIERRERLFEPSRAKREAEVADRQKERALLAKKHGYWPGRRRLIISIDQVF